MTVNNIALRREIMRDLAEEMICQYVSVRALFRQRPGAAADEIKFVD
jgi:hypothetical protein